MSQSQSQARRDFPEIVVFTGDLVGSSKLTSDDLTRAMAALEDAYQDASGIWRGGGWPAVFSAFRGDSWQCLGPAPAFALRGALLLRARLSTLGRPFDTRISIGIGSGWLSRPDTVDVASGPAFELSGHGLDGLGQNRRLAIAWETPPARPPSSERSSPSPTRFRATGHRARPRSSRGSSSRSRGRARRSWPRRSGSPSRASPPISRAAATGRCRRRCAHWRVSDDR